VRVGVSVCVRERVRESECVHLRVRGLHSRSTAGEHRVKRRSFELRRVNNAPGSASAHRRCL